MTKRPRSSVRPWLFVYLGILSGCVPGNSTPPPPDSAQENTPEAAAHPVKTVAEAFLQHRSNTWVEGAGTVVRILRDDTKRPRHQRFVVRIDGKDNLTVLIAHNIDLAPRVPFKKGDRIQFRGEYIWNAQGGVLHETHHDPRGGKESGGWIRWREFVYR